MRCEALNTEHTLEQLSETSNSRELASAANYIVTNNPPYEESLIIAYEAIDKMSKHIPINAYAVEGVRGAGKTTQIDMLVQNGKGISGSRVITPLYTHIIKPRSKDAYMTVFGDLDFPQGGIGDTLLVAAFHSDRLSRIEKEEYCPPLLIDRHWLSFYSLEMYKMIRTGVNQRDAEKLVRLITDKWNPVKGTIILNEITVSDCENRIINRGELPRNAREIAIDTSFEHLISRIQKDGCPLQTFQNNIFFVNATNTPEVIYRDIIKIFQG